MKLKSLGLITSNFHSANKLVLILSPSLKQAYQRKHEELLNFQIEPLWLKVYVCAPERLYGMFVVSVQMQSVLF